MLRQLVWAKQVAALAAALALLCQAVLAVPAAGRMALERTHAAEAPNAPDHAARHNAAGAHTATAERPGTPARPGHSEKEHQACPFCATASLFALASVAHAALRVVEPAEAARPALAALLIPAQLDRSRLSRAPPARL